MIIYWSKNFDQREKYMRQKLADKIENLLKNPAALNASNAGRMKDYIKTKHFDKSTGEVKKINPINVFNYEKYENDATLDGYYAIVTSEINKLAVEILAHYKELWKIEESFQVIESDLEERPVPVSREDHIQGHFLICFIALVILRILELKLSHKYSVNQIKKSLNNSKCKEFTNGFYTIEPLDDVMHDIQKIFGMYITNDIMSSEQLRKLSKAGNTTFF